MNSYYNTTGCADRELREYEQKAVSQEDRVLAYFKRHPHRGFTPSEIYAHVMPDAAPVSPRRAITNLTNSGALVKTTERRNGPYGRPEYVWKLAQPHHASPQRELLI